MLRHLLRYASLRASNLRIRFAVPRDEQVRFRCNICGSACIARRAQLTREQESCPMCRSSVRQRAIIHLLSLQLFGRSMVLQEFPLRRDLVGLDLSGAANYADRLQERLGFTNTFLHKSPKLDISEPDSSWLETCDFLISSDVFEHVAPPVRRAFKNALRLLKPGGVLVLTVPYNKAGETIEHFPELHDWRIERHGQAPIVLNTTTDGRRQRFDELVFHGGEGETLEMRVFSLEGVLSELRASGFTDIQVHGAACLEFGIVWPQDWSLPLTARRPKEVPV